MSVKELDCQGLPCPQPVLQCKHCIDSEKPDEIVLLVDNEAALQNVTRFLTTQGYSVSDEHPSEHKWTIRAIKKNKGAASASPEDASDKAPHVQDTNILVFLTSMAIGEGDPILGEKLMANFLATLPELGPQLWRMILVNGAVRMAVEGSPNLESLIKLEKAGVSILVCGTCLNHFNLLEKKAVGQTTNMLDVVISMQLADKIIQP
jgi:selenium metabolism protein YedF